MQKLNLKIKKLHPDAKTPTYGTEFSAGADLYALVESDLLINPGETALIQTGLALEIPNGYAAFIYARSGLATKEGLAPANKVSVIDSDYRGEIRIPIHNHSAEARTIVPGERIAQLVIAPCFQAVFTETDSLSQTGRGEGGFGSTGKQ